MYIDRRFFVADSFGAGGPGCHVILRVFGYSRLCANE
jgi:hypothetical protein